MNLIGMLGSQDASVLDSSAQSEPQMPQPLVSVIVDYYSGGQIRVRCHGASGEKLPEMMRQLLEGAIEAIEKGVKLEAS